MRTKQTPSGIMSQTEILPQSMVDMTIIVFKPRLDYSDILLTGKKIGPNLFSKFGFKPKSKDVKLLCIDTYFEPFLIIGGKYSIDYCKKHIFRVEVDKSTSKVFVAGQEFKLEKSNSNRPTRKIKVTGEEYVHHERQGYFILDRLKREIPPEKLPIAPFDTPKENPECKSDFKSINISDRKQIQFLKAKIAERPADIAEIINEKFDITDRTLTYYPMYQLTFENSKSKKNALVTINGITGETMVNGNKNFYLKSIVIFPESADSQHGFAPNCNDAEIETILKIPLPETNDKPNSVQEVKKKQVKRIRVEEKETVYGDLEIPSGTTMNKILIVEGSLKIGDNCRAHGKLKALKDITIGADTIIDGDLISGGSVYVGARSLIAGSVKAAKLLEIEESAIIEGVS